MDLLRLAGVCFVVFQALSAASSIQWLGLSKSFIQWNRTSACVQAYKKRLLAGVQKKACKRNLPTMPFLSIASGKVKTTCQDVFSDRRWNCSSINLAPKFGPDLTKGTREQAYVHALSSAAVAHTIARACSEGSISTCSCGKISKEPPPGDFVWGGCAENVRFGIQMAKAFTEMPWNRRKFRKRVDIRMNRHNSRTGWRSVNRAVRTQCKCHGVSGSCDIKTCWRALPPLRELAQGMKRKYEEAKEVEARRVVTRWKLFPLAADVRFSKDDLVYIMKSPDFCINDPASGSAGTKGRFCNETSKGSNGCENMCCGRGYETSWKEHPQRCECKYHWCCYVECNTCTVKKEVTRCL